MRKRSPGLSHRMRDCQVRAGQSVSKSRMSVQELEQLEWIWGDGVEGGSREKRPDPLWTGRCDNKGVHFA